MTTIQQVIDKLTSGPSSRWCRAFLNGYMPKDWETRPIHAMVSPRDPATTIIVNASAESNAGKVVGARREMAVTAELATETGLSNLLAEMGNEMQTKAKERYS